MALGYDGVIRIDTQINSGGFTKGLREMSDSLEKEVRRSEKLLEELQKKRGEALSAAQVKSSAIDEETAKAQALKKELLELRAIADNRQAPEAVRREAEARIPLAQLELEQQKETVDGLRKKYEQISASVEKYDREIASLQGDLEIQRTEAQQAAEALAEAKDELTGLSRSAEVGDEKIVQLSHALAELKERQKTLESAGMGLGFQEYDENVSRIAGITAQLKAYQKALQKSGEDAGTGGKLLESLEKIGKSFDGGGLDGLAGDWQKQLENLRDGLQDAAQAVGDAWENMLGKVKKSAEAAGKLVAAAVKGGAALAGKALSAAGRALPMVREMNGAARATEALRGKLEQLGSTLKRALVFSVVYRGVSMLRQEMSAYLMVNQQFVNALAQIRGVLLTAFQPVYEAVVPALAALMNMLSGVIAAVSQFTASLFGTTAKKAQKNAAALYQQAHAVKSVGGAAKEAAKEAETAVAAFDEFNILSFPEQSGGGGGGGVGDIAMPDFDYDYGEPEFDSWGEAFSAFLDKLLAGIPKLEDAFRKFADWLNGLSKKLYDMFTFPGVLEKVERLGRDLAGAFNKLVNWIDWYQLGKALGAGLNLALQFLTEFIYNFDWMNLRRKLADIVNGLATENAWYDFGRLLWAGFKISLEMLAGFLMGLDMPLLAEAAGNIVKGFFDEMKNTVERIQWKEIGGQIAAFLNNIDWYGVITSALAAIAAALTALKNLVDGFVDGLQWGDIARKIYTAVNDSFGQVDWTGMGQTLGNAFIQAVSFLRDLIAGIDWYQIGADVGRFLVGIDWVGALGALAETIAAAIGAAIRAVRGFLDAVTPHIQEIAQGIAEKINGFFRSVDWAEAGRVISDGLEAALDFALEFMRSVDWNEIGRSIVTLLEHIDWGSLLSKWGELMGETMTAKLKLISWEDVAEVGAHAVEGLLKGMLDKIASIGTWLKEHLVDPIVNGVKELLGIHSPSTVFAEIGENLIAGLLQGISESWSGIAEFFTGAWEAIREKTAEVWNSIQETLRAIWDGIREKAGAVFTEVKEKIGAAWDALKEKTSSIWNSIKTSLETTWNNLKTTVTTVFTEIKNKVVEVWTTIKNEAVSKWNEIKSAISEKIENIKTAVSEGFAKVKDIITGKVTEAIDALKNKDWASVGRGIVDGIANGLNGIFDKLRSWASRVWDSVSSAFDGGGKSSGSGGRRTGSRAASYSAYRMTPELPAGYSAAVLPKLANGAVIPPNRQFAAILGDQRSGVNIETPLKTIETALQNVMERYAGSGDINITVESVLDGKVIARNTVTHINDMTRSAGKPVLLF